MTERVPAWTASQIREAERPLLEAGIPLMRRAASALAAVLEKELGDAPRPRVLILAGSGDNGGDAMFAAAEVVEHADVDILLVSPRFHEQAFATAVAAGARNVELTALRHPDPAYGLVVDGILGIGPSKDRALRGTAREAVALLLPAVRDGSARVVAVDLPSGLDPDSGAADEMVLPASLTVTFGGVKVGLTRGRGPELSGDVVLVDIGLGIERAVPAVPPAGEASISGVYRA